MPLTLEEIAKQAGVSRSTVSRVLNEHPNVSADARQRVLAVTQRLDFQPNVAARSLALGRTQIIGLVIPERVSSLFTDPYFPMLIQGVSAASNAHDYSVMLWLADPDYERRRIRKIVQGGMIDGVIIASMLIDDPLVAALTERQLPFILVGRHPTDTRINYVDVDNRLSARDMVAHLLRLGHRRVATITGPKNMIAGADRLEGYTMALRERGLAFDPSLVFEGDFTEAGGYAGMLRLLAHSPNAVFVASDTMALGALRALREAGKRVPQDIAIASYDDMPFAARIDPPLTSVRQPVQRAGYVAAETLMDLISDPDSAPRRIILPTELVIRASSGPAVNGM
jgi:LacI family transcriptional regulator, galactose operon repressor